MQNRYPTWFAGAAVILQLTFTACEKEELNPESSGSSIDAVEMIDGSRELDIAGIHEMLRPAGEDWTPLPQSKAHTGLPLTHIRRSEMLPREFHASVTDGNTVVPGPVVDMAVYEGLTEDGRKALFLLSADQIAGWYETSGERIIFQSQNLGNPQGQRDMVNFHPESKRNPMAPAIQGCGNTELADPKAGLPEPSAADKGAANCWKLEVLVHGDYQYYIGPAASNYNLAVFGLVSTVVLGDAPFAAVNMDLVIPNGSLVVTTSPTYLTADANQLINIVSTFWSQFPYTRRDLVLYVSGNNLYTSQGDIWGLAYIGVVCSSYTYSTALVEWIRNGDGSAWSAAIGRVTSHEIGHLLSCVHTDVFCTSVPGSADLMYSAPMAPCGSNSFMTPSRGLLNVYIGNNQSCLSQGICN